MVENYKPKPEVQKAADDIMPKSKPKPEALKIIKAKHSIETKVEINTPESKEEFDYSKQDDAQMLAGQSSNPSSGKQDDLGQTMDQTSTGGSMKSSYTKSAEIRALELEQQQEIQEQKEEEAALAENEQKIKELKEELQKIKPKGKEQPSGQGSENSQNEDYYQSQGQ